MTLIEHFFHPAVILLAVGGGRAGEDPKAGAFAIQTYFRPQAIVPMHYGTAPHLATEADVRAVFAGDRRVQVLRPGEEKRF